MFNIRKLKKKTTSEHKKNICDLELFKEFNLK